MPSGASSGGSACQALELLSSPVDDRSGKPDQACPGRDVHDRAAATTSHCTRCFLEHQERADDVHVENLAGGVEARVEELDAREVEARVVHEDIRSTQGLGGGDSSGGGRRVGNIAGDEDRAIAELGDHRPPRALPPCNQNDGGVLGDEQAGDRGADALVAP